MAKALLKIKLS